MEKCSPDTGFVKKRVRLAWRRACVSVARRTKLSFDRELCCPVPEKLNLENSLS